MKVAAGNIGKIKFSKFGRRKTGDSGVCKKQALFKSFFLSALKTKEPIFGFGIENGRSVGISPILNRNSTTKG